jgi:hypothetical protein
MYFVPWCVLVNLPPTTQTSVNTCWCNSTWTNHTPKTKIVETKKEFFDKLMKKVVFGYLFKRYGLNILYKGR